MFDICLIVVIAEQATSNGIFNCTICCSSLRSHLIIEVACWSCHSPGKAVFSHICYCLSSAHLFLQKLLLRSDIRWSHMTFVGFIVLEFRIVLGGSNWCCLWNMNSGYVNNNEQNKIRLIFSASKWQLPKEVSEGLES